MKKSVAGLIIALAAVFFALTVNAAECVKVRIAPYYTQIDDMSVYNPAVEFPILTYKNVTYLPLTHGLCAKLGYAVGFDSEKGFFITKHRDMVYTLDESPLFGKDAENYYGVDYTAYIADYPIYLNGIRIDNTKEEYPFLNFRGITYLPLTYRFAVEEMCLDIEWSEKDGFFLNSDRRQIFGDFGKHDENGVTLITQIQGYTTEKASDGTEEYHYYAESSKHRLHYENEFAEKLDGKPTENDYAPYSPIPECTEMTLENGSLCYSSEPIVPTNAHSQYSRKYEFDGITFICTNLNLGTAPAPYTAHGEHIFVLKDGKITHLAEWDTKNNLTKILSDGDGGYYLCSDSYSPTGASRWSNPFACVWRYTNNGEFREVTIPDTNSISAIGTYGTKL